MLSMSGEIMTSISRQVTNIMHLGSSTDPTVDRIFKVLKKDGLGVGKLQDIYKTIKDNLCFMLVADMKYILKIMYKNKDMHKQNTKKMTAELIEVLKRNIIKREMNATKKGDNE